MCVTDLRKLIEPAREEFLFSGNERVRYDGINDYDFHARRYNAAIPRFDKQDRLNEDYPWLSPYAYCAGNPVMNTDRNGEKVRVAKEYQEMFEKDLNAVFGDKSKAFSFDDNGILQYEGTEKDLTEGMSKDQKKAFKGLNKVMKNKETTDVVYENEYELTVGDEKKNTDIINEYGGAVCSLKDNVIVVAPDAQEEIRITLNEDDWKKNKDPYKDIKQNSTTLLFHEIGERITSDKTYRGAAIDYENNVRRIMDLSLRPYDLYHKKKPLLSY